MSQPKQSVRWTLLEIGFYGNTRQVLFLSDCPSFAANHFTRNAFQGEEEIWVSGESYYGYMYLGVTTATLWTLL